MGFDFTNDQGTYLRFSPSGWALALVLAESFGWKPEGTTLPPSDEEPIEWTGEYATNDGQRASASDAAALADACVRALADPDYEDRAVSTLIQINKVVAEQYPSYQPDPVNKADMTQFRERLHELIAFCREGSFIIE